MAAMDMPIAAVWDKQEWSSKIVDKEIESADKETESNNVAEAGNGLYYDRCCCCAWLS
ncbi:hypothetical protein L195_g059413 [Trifolium pratense]|uniref:Uncharacterized protein n=1 Tax=Trifolium pratense TaxID=57577 RepID=A0A2K3JXW2_TRIPR|nr:hypothetical protein L195_g059413 [Trifolium pratense]